MKTAKAQDLMEVIGDYILWFQSRIGWILLDMNGQTVDSFGMTFPDESQVTSIINAYEATQ